MTRVVKLVGDLHMIFHMADVINGGAWGVIKLLGDACAYKRLKRDPTYQWQTTRDFLRLLKKTFLIEEGIEFKKWLDEKHPNFLNDNAMTNETLNDEATEGDMNTTEDEMEITEDEMEIMDESGSDSDSRQKIIKTVQMMRIFRKEREESDDEVLRLSTRLLKMINLLFDQMEPLRCSDGLALTQGYHDFLPLFAVSNKPNYTNLGAESSETRFKCINSLERDTLMVNKNVRGNKGSNPIACDDGCEQQNRREKMPPEVGIKKTITRSEHATAIHKSIVSVDYILGKLDEDGNKKITKSVPPSEKRILARLSEAVRKGELFTYVPGRKIAAVNKIASLDFTTELGKGDVQSNHGAPNATIQNVLATVYPNRIRREEVDTDNETPTRQTQTETPIDISINDRQ